MTLDFLNYLQIQALPIFLDKIFHPVVAVILSVTFVLAFGEVCCSPFVKVFHRVELLEHICWPKVMACFSFRFHLQVIPQAICTRYGLAVGANFVWLVRILMIICYPVAYPIGKVFRFFEFIVIVVGLTKLDSWGGLN